MRGSGLLPARDAPGSTPARTAGMARPHPETEFCWRRALLILLALLGFRLTAVGATVAWACVPQPLISLHPTSSGPPGAQVTVNALVINGRAEIRWNSPDGPLLETATGPSFSVPITIPDAPSGLYGLIVVERDAGGALGSSGTAAFQVTAPGVAGSTESGFTPQPDAGLATNLSVPQPSPRGTPLGLLAAVGVGLLTLGGLGGVLLGRSRSSTSIPPTSEGRGDS